MMLLFGDVRGLSTVTSLALETRIEAFAVHEHIARDDTHRCSLGQRLQMNQQAFP
jgi:hypothetical protein